MDNNHSNEGSLISNNGRNRKPNTKKGKGVKLSTDPQSVAARERRHRISERFKILQSLVPGGSKMDTVSMLEEAIQYVKFLKTQVWLHQAMIDYVDHGDPSLFLPEFLESHPHSTTLPSQQMFDHDLSTDSQVLHAMPQLGFEDYYLRDEENMPFDAPMMY